MNDLLLAIKGMDLRRVTSLADGLSVQFGDLYDRPGGKGRVGAIALHVVCAWRIEVRERILTGQKDRPDTCFSQLKLLFPNEVARGLETDATKHIVQDVVLSGYGDLAICTPHFCLRVFLAASSLEGWRIFRPGDMNSHFVAGGEDNCLDPPTLDTRRP